MTEFPLESSRVLEYEKDVDRLSQAIDAHLQHARERKWSRAMQWFRNAAFLAGQHMDTFKYAQGGTFTQSTVVIPPRLQDAMSPQMVDNHVLRIVQANIAELTGTNPYPLIEPASLSPDDQDLAEIGKLILQVLWETPLRVPEKLRMLVGYLSVTGTAGAETLFGQMYGVEQKLKKELQDIPDLVSGGTVKDWVETGEPEWVYKSGLNMRVWSGFHLDVNPDATSDPDSLTWICRTTFEDVTLMQEMFKGEGFIKGALKGIGPQDCSDDALWHWEQMKDLIDSPASDLPLALERGSRRSLSQCVRVRMIDCRPNLEHPMGRTIIQVGGRVVYAGPSRSWSEEYPERWTPVRIARWWTLPGRFEGVPLISPLVPLQKRINALHAIIRLNRQHMGIGAWLLPKVCNVPEGFIGPMAGQNITYRPGPRGEKPERMEFQPLTPDVWEELAMCVSSMERIGGIAGAQLSSSSSPSAIRSGTMLDFGQRQALQSKSALMLDFEAFVGGLAQDILQEVARNMPDDPELLRRVSVAARGLGDLAMERYKSLDLRDNVRVQIDLRSQMLQTPEAKKEAAATFLQFAGQNMTAIERAKVAQVMGLDELESQVSAQWKRATRMVERILQGDVSVAVVLEGVDDPALFGEVIRDAMLSERALTAPPESKQALQSLFDSYSQQMQARAQTMAAALAEQTQNSNGVATPAQPGQTGA